MWVSLKSISINVQKKPICVLLISAVTALYLIVNSVNLLVKPKGSDFFKSLLGIKTSPNFKYRYASTIRKYYVFLVTSREIKIAKILSFLHNFET